jgi:hypothetical protein
MPLKKCRSVEEMPAPDGRPPQDPDLRIAFAWMKLACELRPLRREPGVRRLSSLDDLSSLDERRQG